MATTKTPIVDIHTHVYPPSYIELLKARSSIPYIRSFPPSPSLRLVILPAEDTESTSRGRPVGPEYFDIAKKIEFMDTHSIDISVIVRPVSIKYVSPLGIESLRAYLKIPASHPVHEICF